MKTLLVATSNVGKLTEIKDILKDLPFEIKNFQDVGFNEDIRETGKTFRENAEIKARTAGKKTGLLTLAEDSGLEVEYLGGAPGIYSARYANGTDMDRVNKLLSELRNVHTNDRMAKFICVAALFDPESSQINFFEGVSSGFITEEPSGKNGFGYDPVFYNSDLNKTNSEAGNDEKNRVSHRARAILKVKEYLRSV